MNNFLLSLTLLSVVAPSALAGGAADDALAFFAGHPAALTRLKTASENGNAEASVRLAMSVYNACIDVVCDTATRTRYLNLASSQGSDVPRAAELYAQATAPGATATVSIAASQKLDQLAAKSNDTEVWVYVAVLNLTGHGAAKQQEAIRYLSKAATAGVPRADRLIASMYLQGISVQRNYDKGLVWLASAIRKGDAQAANDLGTAYQLGGYGLRINDAEAEVVYRRGVQIGCASCAVKLSEILLTRGKPADLKETGVLAQRLSNGGSYYPAARAAFNKVTSSKASGDSMKVLAELATQNYYGEMFYVLATSRFPAAGEVSRALDYSRDVNPALMQLPAGAVPALLMARDSKGD